jgi:Kef-type K+ transport system membrane component KefB
VLGVIRGSSGLNFDSTVLGLAILALVLVALPALMHRLSDATLGRLMGAGSGLPLVVAVAVAAGAASSMVGLHPIVGALAAGLTFPRGPDTTDALDHVGRIATSVLAPVFFVDSCRSAPLQLFGHLPADELARLPIVLAAAIIGKLLAGEVAGRIDGLNRADRAGLGILLNCRGVTEIAVAAAGEATGLITPTAFLLLYLVALTTTALTAPAWRRFVEPSAGESPTATG